MTSSCRPVLMFTRLATQPCIMSSIFPDHNTGVNRREWTVGSAEAGVGRIHRLPEGDYNLTSYHSLIDKLGTVAWHWFLLDYVKLCQVEQLYGAGYDDMSGALFMIAKEGWQQSHLAEQYVEFISKWNDS